MDLLIARMNVQDKNLMAMAITPTPTLPVPIPTEEKDKNVNSTFKYLETVPKSPNPTMQILAVCSSAQIAFL